MVFQLMILHLLQNVQMSCYFSKIGNDFLLRPTIHAFIIAIKGEANASFFKTKKTKKLFTAMMLGKQNLAVSLHSFHSIQVLGDFLIYTSS